VPGALREFQNRYAKALTICFELYAQGKRCALDEEPARRLDCSSCERRDADDFCRSNFRLKKLVKQIAECLARKMAARQQAARANDEDAPRRGWTPEAVESFRAKGMSYEIETPLCEEHIWIVPKHSGRDRIEFTPEEMVFFLQAADAVDGKIVEIGKKRPDTEDDSMPANTDAQGSDRTVR